MGVDEDRTLRRLGAYRKIATRLITRFRGRLANTAGDSLLIEFGSAVDAVECALKLQERIAAENADLRPDERMEFRLGLHAGDVLSNGGDIFGDGVNVAARLQSLAAPGGLCVSATIVDSVAGKLQLALDDMGDQRLRNIAHPVRAYRLHSRHAVSVRRVDASPPEPRFGTGAPSVAVLPFVNLSGDPTQEYFADGMVEDITSALSHFKWMFVIARNTSFTYKGKPVDVREVARNLGVRYVVEGSVRKARERVLIAAQLIEGETAAHLWAGNFEGDMSDVFRLQEEVATKIVTYLEPTLLKAETARARRKPTQNLDAYDYYLRAIALGRLNNQQANREILNLLRRAIELDPQYAAARARAAMCYTARRDQGWGVLSCDEVDEALMFARTAVELGPDDPTVLTVSGHAIASLARDHGQALALIERALRINPNYAEAWGRSSMVHIYAGHLDIAIAHAKKSLELTPLGPDSAIPLGAMGYAHIFCSRFEEAIEAAQLALRARARFGLPYRVMVAALAHAGRLSEAAASAAALREVDPLMTIENWRNRTSFAIKDHVDILVEGFRVAGIPES